MNLDLKIQKIQDPETKQAFTTLKEALLNSPFISGGFQKYDFSFQASESGVQAKHNLKTLPNAFFVVVRSGSAPTLLYSQWTDSKIVFDVAGLGDFTILLGRL